MDPEAPLQPFLVECLDRLEAEAPRILDVGAGPMTVVGKQYRGKRLDITAVDPLADGYDRLIRRHKLTPPVRTTLGRAESLSELFEEASFDLAHASNCIDHSTDPVAAIEQMVRVVKPGGFVVLRHASREAERNSYTGLHQWNFFVEDGAFMVGNPTRTENLTRRFDGRAEVDLRVGEGGMITAVLRKVQPAAGLAG
jgi:ubiquinone/menaquinone biosynthesis C-methylase UbiE